MQKPQFQALPAQELANKSSPSPPPQKEDVTLDEDSVNRSDQHASDALRQLVDESHPHQPSKEALHREEMQDDSLRITTLRETRRWASSLWRDAHQSRVLRSRSLAEQPTESNGAELIVQAKREEQEEEVSRKHMRRGGVSLSPSLPTDGLSSLLDNWSRFDRYIPCPVCGVSCCSSPAELASQHLPQCLQERQRVEEAILHPIGIRRTAGSGTRQLPIPRVQEIRGEIDVIVQTLLVCSKRSAIPDLGLDTALVSRRHEPIVTAAGQPASPPPPSSLRDYIEGTYTQAARGVLRRLLLPCPMGKACCAAIPSSAGHRGEPMLLSHDEIENHAMSCWRISFVCNTDGGEFVPTGRVCSMSEIFCCAEAASGGSLVKVSDLSVLDALAVCDAQLHRMLTRKAPEGRFVGLTRLVDDAVVLLSTQLVNAWCSCFAVHAHRVIGSCLHVKTSDKQW